MSKHTPGPWHIAGNLVIEEANATTIAQIAIGDGEANARLIAAAPLLLEAANNLVAAYHVGDPGSLHISIKAIRAAIAAAEGDTSE